MVMHSIELVDLLSRTVSTSASSISIGSVSLMQNQGKASCKACSVHRNKNRHYNFYNTVRIRSCEGHPHVGSRHHVLSSFVPSKMDKFIKMPS